MGTDLFYTESGEGAPLILLHGNGESSDYFKSQIPVFSNSFHVFALDTRGHGRSGRGTEPFTLVRFAEDLKAFLDARKIDKANLLGFSDGGNVALLFALRYPERVERLVLNGANLSPKGVKAAIQVPIVLGYGIALALSPFSKKAKANKEMLGLMATQPQIAPNELSRLAMPALVIAGTKDMIKESHTREIARALPNAKLCIIDGDHFIAAKKSDEFNKRVLAFLLS